MRPLAVGALFGVKDNSIEKTELLVLITPRVVRNKEEARKITEELRDRIDAVAPKHRSVTTPDSDKRKDEPGKAPPVSREEEGDPVPEKAVSDRKSDDADKKKTAARPVGESTASAAAVVPFAEEDPRSEAADAGIMEGSGDNHALATANR